MKKSNFKIEIIEDKDFCKILINDIEIEEVVEEYQIVKKGGEPPKLIIQIPLLNENIRIESNIK